MLFRSRYKWATEIPANLSYSRLPYSPNSRSRILRVADAEGVPVTSLTTAYFTIAALNPASGDESFSKWVAYVYREQIVTGSADGDWPNPDGTSNDQAYRESTGVFTNNGDGTYSYVYDTDISTVVTPVEGTVIPYDRTLTHRVAVEFGGHSGPTDDATFDFVPDGSPVTVTRNIVETATCQQCHGEEFSGHGGDRVSVEDCVTCHTPATIDPQSGETVDFKVMIHKIHMGGELSAVPGADGEVWDDLDTTEDESADNVEYAIWGYGDSKVEWSAVGFPAVIANCTKCHQGSGAEVDNWKEVPSRAVCGSCHDDVDFATGTNHDGGAQADDSLCTTCHGADGTATYAPTVWEAHDLTTNYAPQDVPEFDVSLTVSTPANGLYFVAGETPVVTIVMTDSETGAIIDHTTVVEDPDGKEGCDVADDPCPTRDGLFDHAYLMVDGPRARRVPVLSTVARVEVESDAGPFDLSAADTLDLVVDGGMDLQTRTDEYPATISVDVADGTFVDDTAATVDEIVTWLNDDVAFADRAIAYVTEDDGVGIRSRNLGDFFSLQLEDSDVTTEVFDGDTEEKVIGGSYAYNNLLSRTSASNNDPKVAWSTGEITYTLDPVDDLQPGTYVASVEITDAGRISDTDYRTPSVAKVTFQVGQADEELAPAGNCDSCHQGPDGGFIFDQARHHKIFDQTAIDQCGGCHDYQNRYATGDWSGGNPIARRVHAVHNGSALNYPVETVGHDDTVAGRYWDITFPQDVRNCETCHETGTTSGSWATNPSRLPCSGCHDSDAAAAHIKLQTWDPTSDDPWSGDEEESCAVCH